MDMAADGYSGRGVRHPGLPTGRGVQWMLADCAEKIYIARLMLLHIAFKMERGMDLRQENSIAKNYIAHMLADVVDTGHAAARLARLLA